MKSIRKGILLARHDFKHAQFDEKHKDLDDPIVEGMHEVYLSTERLIIGDGPLNDLTVKAYYRTMEKLRGEESSPE